MFYRIIVKHDMKGFPTTSKEVFGKFELGGFSSQLGFFDHLKEELQIRYDNGQGKLTKKKLRPGDCFHFPPGSVHQEEAITNCEIIDKAISDADFPPNLIPIGP